MIDEYCERHGSGPFEEPFNTISNIVFIWAAVEAWNLAGRHRVRTPEMHLLIFLAATVGIGSAIWHVFNGALIYCAMRTIILKQASQSVAARLS